MKWKNVNMVQKFKRRILATFPDIDETSNLFGLLTTTYDQKFDSLIKTIRTRVIGQLKITLSLCRIAMLCRRFTTSSRCQVLQKSGAHHWII